MVKLLSHALHAAATSRVAAVSASAFWRPGIRLIGRMPFAAKAGLISLAFMLPLAVLAVLFAQARLTVSQSASLEHEGLAYVREAVTLVHRAQGYRAEVLQQASNRPAPGLVPARQALDAQLSRLALLDAGLQDRLGTTAQLGKVRTAAQALVDGSAGLMKAYASHARFSESLYALVAAAADGSNLTLDPDLDTHYLMDAGILRLPRLLDEVGRMRSLAVATAAAGQGGEIAAVELNRLDTLVEEMAGQALQDVAKVAQARPALQSAIALGPVLQALAKFRDLATDAPGTGGVARAAQLDSAAELPLVAGWAAQARLVTLLEDLLAKRRQQATEALASVGVAVGLCLLLAGYLFYAFYLVMRGGLQQMRQHLVQMAGGDLTHPPVPKGQDEVADLVRVLGDMQQSIGGIVRQVRQSAESIASSSGQIAVGAVDMSSRTEQAASSLQQSSTAMTQISATVEQTARVATEAARLADENASVAGQGGQIVGQMVATMDDINQASRRIGDILGVIDGIAFQTNILALNAAVEAARAGEQGRGFAVVATEVRMLAQRSAAAAHEIKDLIGTSMDKVETGAAVVREAGQTMGRIVTNADQIRGLLGMIAEGARQQSSGLGAIGGAVRQLDESTQQNAALSEETAASANALSHQATGLVAEVARFKLPG